MTEHSCDGNPQNGSDSAYRNQREVTVEPLVEGPYIDEIMPANYSPINLELRTVQ